MREKTLRKRGRPPLPKGQGKKAPLNMRTTQSIRDQLESAAKAEGRSLAEEVEARLVESFRSEDAWGGRGLRSLLLLMSALAQMQEQATGKGCTGDADTLILVKQAWDQSIDEIIKSLRAKEKDMDKHKEWRDATAAAAMHEVAVRKKK